MCTFRYLALLIAFIVLIPTTSWGARKAFVTAERAIIYADKDLSAPIGFVRKGKSVWVGEVARVNGTILPVIVAGKIAYIRVQDLADSYDEAIFSQGPQTTEHHYFNLEAEEFDDPLSQNNDVILTWGQFDLGSQWNSFSQRTGTTASESGSFFRLLYEHRHPLKRINWGLGGGLYLLSGNNADFSMYSIDIQFNILPAKWEYFQLELPLVISYAPKAKIQARSLNLSKRGSAFGFLGGVQGRLFPQWKVGVVVGWNYHYYLFNGFREIAGSGTDTVSLNRTGGHKLYAGLHYKL